ncbi:MAG: creatininase family protein, partial [Bacteroidales bacterium]
MIPIDLTQSNYGDVRKIKYDLAVLPWGATEPHNLHLSYTTDCLLSQAVAIDAAKRAYEKGVNVMVLPSIPLGAQNPGQRDEPFCIHTRYETQKMVLTDIVASLYHQGMRKLVIVNGHGGNSFKPMIRDLAVDYPDFIIAVTDWFAIVPPAGYFENKDDHAGELETSAMLYYYPEITDLSKAGEGKGIPF